MGGSVAGAVFPAVTALSDCPPDAGTVDVYVPLEAGIDVGVPDTACVGAAAPTGVDCSGVGGGLVGEVLMDGGVALFEAGAGEDPKRLEATTTLSVANGEDADFTPPVAAVTVPTAPTPTAPAKIAVRPAENATAVRPPGDAVHPKKGSWLIHARPPLTALKRFTETAIIARTTVGSKWLPAQRASSARACAAGIAFL